MSTHRPDDEFINRTMTSFSARFGTDAESIAQAPGRVNLLGEHTDYTGGLVLPIAIDRWTLAATGTTSTRESRVRAQDMDVELGVDLARPNRRIATAMQRFDSTVHN